MAAGDDEGPFAHRPPEPLWIPLPWRLLRVGGRCQCPGRTARERRETGEFGVLRSGEDVDRRDTLPAAMDSSKERIAPLHRLSPMLEGHPTLSSPRGAELG